MSKFKVKSERVIVEFNRGDWLVMFPYGRIAAFETPDDALRAIQRDAKQRLGDITVTTIEWRNTPPGFEAPKGS